MAKNREAAQSFILKYIERITGNKDNVDIYTKLFSEMSDKDFDKFIDELESEERFLSLIIPNFGSTKINVENNLKIGSELGHDFFQKLWIEAHDDIPTHQTPNKFLVIDLPLRRASQLLTKKISVPKHNKVIDALTGQPTGESKGAKISYPELQVCAAMGLESSMIELMKYRGGDNKGMAALSGMLSKYGTANLKTLSNYASGVESTKTLRTFLTCCHLKNNL